MHLLAKPIALMPNALRALPTRSLTMRTRRRTRTHSRRRPRRENNRRRFHVAVQTPRAMVRHAPISTKARSIAALIEPKAATTHPRHRNDRTPTLSDTPAQEFLTPRDREDLINHTGNSIKSARRSKQPARPFLTLWPFRREETLEGQPFSDLRSVHRLAAFRVQIEAPPGPSPARSAPGPYVSLRSPNVA
jgi:hypothetical protein